MKHYINKNKQIFGFDLDGSQDHLITEDMVKISLEEIQTINQAKEDEYKSTPEYKTNEANQYLKDTDWANDYKIRHDLGLEIISELSSKWIIINKRSEYINYLKGLTI